MKEGQDLEEEQNNDEEGQDLEEEQDDEEGQDLEEEQDDEVGQDLEEEQDDEEGQDTPFACQLPGQSMGIEWRVFGSRTSLHDLSYRDASGGPRAKS